MNKEQEKNINKLIEQTFNSMYFTYKEAMKSDAALIKKCLEKKEVQFVELYNISRQAYFKYLIHEEFRYLKESVFKKHGFNLKTLTGEFQRISLNYIKKMYSNTPEAQEAARRSAIRLNEIINVAEQQIQNFEGDNNNTITNPGHREE